MWTMSGRHPLSLVPVNLTATISSGSSEGGARMSWTDERVDQLRSLWTEGLSASQIARVLGDGITRNAVIGKVHRLGLAGRAAPARIDRPRLPSAPRVHFRVREPELPVVEEEPLKLDDGSFVGVLAINDRMCRWPIGDPSGDEFHFCGRNPKSGSPYCEAHARKAYQPQQVRDRRRMAS